MSDLKGSNSAPTLRSLGRSESGQVVLVLQGGGALGSYQAGVYQALHEAGIEPDWIIGTSIGAINASLIAGNSPPASSGPTRWPMPAIAIRSAPTTPAITRPRRWSGPCASWWISICSINARRA